MKVKKFGFELFLISMSVLSLSSAAFAEDTAAKDKKVEPKVHQAASVGAGYSPGTGATVGATASIQVGVPKKADLDRDYNSVTQVKLEPKIEGNLQLNAADGAVQKVGVAVTGFSITQASDNRANGGEGIGIIRMLSPTLQYKKDNRIGLTELPRLDYYRVGATSVPGSNGNMCGIMAPAMILSPNAVQALAVDGKARAGFSWNVDAFCHADLGKKTGQLDVQAGAEITLMTDGNTMERAYAEAKVKNIGGSPVYAGAEVSHTALSVDTSTSRSVTDTSVVAGIAF